MDQVKFQFILKAVLHKFYLVHSWILCLKYQTLYYEKVFTFWVLQLENPNLKIKVLKEVDQWVFVGWEYSKFHTISSLTHLNPMLLFLFAAWNIRKSMVWRGSIGPKWVTPFF